MNKCPECGHELELDFDFGNVPVIACWGCGYAMPDDEVKDIVGEGLEGS